MFETVLIWDSNPEPLMLFSGGDTFRLSFSVLALTDNFWPLLLPLFGSKFVDTAFPFMRTVVSKTELFGLLELFLVNEVTDEGRRLPVPSPGSSAAK